MDAESTAAFAKLFDNMNRPRSFPETDAATRRLVEEQEQLQNTLADDFANRHGLTRYRGMPDWWRIIGKSWGTKPPDWNLPEDDHGELFARDGKPVAWVSHAFAPLTDARLRRMCEAAERYDLKFTIDARDWYYPGNSFLVVWTRRDDPMGTAPVR